MKNLIKSKHAAGGYKFLLTENKSNIRYGEVKKNAIIKAIEDSWVEGVYITSSGNIKKQMLNGTYSILMKEKGSKQYYWI